MIDIDITRDVSSVVGATREERTTESGQPLGDDLLIWVLDTAQVRMTRQQAERLRDRLAAALSA